MSVLLSKKLGTLALAADTPLAVPSDALAGAFQLTVGAAFTGAVAAGTLLVESGPFPGYTGTWALEATITFGAGAYKAAHIQGNHLALRVRCSADLTGGSADVYCIAMR